MNPGATTRARASIVRLPESGASEIRAILPPAMPTSRTASSPVSGSRTRPPLMTTSYVWAQTGRQNSRQATTIRRFRIFRSWLVDAGLTGKSGSDCTSKNACDEYRALERRSALGLAGCAFGSRDGDLVCYLDIEPLEGSDAARMIG